MLSIDLPTELEHQLIEVIQKSYHGNIQVAIASLLHLHKKYGWKEQLLQDVETIRAEVCRTGGISSKAIDEAINRYRKTR
ncbi:hypothetical protein FJZ31_07715 [Candidatus Poribacteria bacterium]|nr:hypothetical protein [Candidatus Poribacteria bacterium]